jgi:hypothetical protein
MKVSITEEMRYRHMLCKYVRVNGVAKTAQDIIPTGSLCIDN